MDKIWSLETLPCPFTFKMGYVLKRDESTKFIGYCRECENSILGSCDKTSENHTFNISTRDSRSIRHFKKRPLSSTMRDKSKQDLLHVKALKFKRHEAQVYMNYGNVEGPLVHGTPVLRKTRQESVFQKYGVKSTKNVIDAVANMKLQQRWSNTIKEIGDFPFHVIFWTSEQMDLWKLINSQEKVSVSIDAAGRFVKKIKTSGEITSHIFLYVMSLSIGRRIYPIFQFISEYQAAIFIKHCIKRSCYRWLECLTKCYLFEHK